MKKTVFSLTIIMAVIISAFSIFAMPASADFNTDDILQPNESIVLSDDDDYYEVYLDGFQARRAYYIPVYIHQPGLHIIQTFGITNGSNMTRIQLCDSNRNVLIGNNTGFVGAGYDVNSFLQYNMTQSVYYLKVTLQSTERVQLSITYADRYFENGAPIGSYFQIANFYSNYETFDSSTPAKVWILEDLDGGDDTAGNKVVRMELETNSYVYAYLIDPSSPYLYDALVIHENGDIAEYVVPNGVDSLYIVLFVKWNAVTETEIVEARITIEVFDQT